MRAAPFGLLDRLLLRELVLRFLATLAGATSLYLVIDFADRSTMIGRHALSSAAAEFYLNKAAVIVYQVAPAALVLAAAMLVSRLSRTGELHAIFALGIRPLRLLFPLLVLASLVAASLFALGEGIIVDADARMDEITFRKFGDWGDRARYHHDSTWLRGIGGARFFKLGRFVDGGFEPVTVLEIVPPFSLERRLDAQRLEPLGKKWRLSHVTEGRYQPDEAPGGKLSHREYPELVESFPDTLADLALRSGRPRQMRWRPLREQTRLRERHGQPVLEWKLALAERASQAAVAIPAALVGFLLALAALTSRKKQALATSIALGLCVTSVLWATGTIAHAAALTGLLPPYVAGASGSILSGVVALALLALVRA